MECMYTMYMFRNKTKKKRKDDWRMAKLTFMGGIHPYDGKDLSKDKPMKAVLPKGDLVYPLSQHIGAPAVPVVAKGDHVLTGQKIAEAQGFVSAPIYATVSGTVKAIEPHRVVTGDNVMSIVIEDDHLTVPDLRLQKNDGGAGKADCRSEGNVKAVPERKGNAGSRR